jgi:hypothetical protein
MGKTKRKKRKGRSLGKRAHSELRNEKQRLKEISRKAQGNTLHESELRSIIPLSELSERAHDELHYGVLAPDEEIMEQELHERALKALNPDPEPMGEQGEEKVINSQTFKRKRVRLTENLSPVLMAGDVLVNVAGRYVKDGEHPRVIVMHQRRAGFLGWLFPLERVEHPNNFIEAHVEAIPNIFQPIYKECGCGWHLVRTGMDGSEYCGYCMKDLY